MVGWKKFDMALVLLTCSEGLEEGCPLGLEEGFPEGYCDMSQSDGRIYGKLAESSCFGEVIKEVKFSFYNSLVLMDSRKADSMAITIGNEMKHKTHMCDMSRGVETIGCLTGGHKSSPQPFHHEGQQNYIITHLFRWIGGRLSTRVRRRLTRRLSWKGIRVKVRHVELK